MTIRRLSCFALAAVLAGCASAPSAPLSHPTAQVGAYRDTIELEGKLSANYDKDGQPQSITVNYTWNQRPGNIDVTLFAPGLGQTVATVNVTPTAATLTQSNRAPLVEKDVDTLTAKALGWTLPVSGLRDWLQGYAVEAGGKRFAASPANARVVTSDGWHLDFTEWQDGTGGVPQPRRIDATRAASAGSGELAIRIIVTPAG